jgi:hypothetical protein
MVAQVKDIVARQHVALIDDLIGVAALFAALYVCLAFTF